MNPDLIAEDFLLDVIRPSGDALPPSAWKWSGSRLYNVLNDPNRPLLFEHEADSWCTDHRISLNGRILFAARLSVGDSAVVSVECIGAPHRSWTSILGYSWIGSEDDAGTNGFYLVRPGLLAYVCECSDA